MSATIVDVLVFIPLVPAIFVIAFSRLPWKRWTSKLLHKSILGPYLLYCAFAIWHFKESWWTTSLVGLCGTVVSAMAIFDLRKARRSKQARDRKAKMLEQAQDWPAADGFLLHSGQSRDADGTLKLTLSYMYRVQGEEFYGSASSTFTSEDDASRFESGCREKKFKVRYQQDKPETSVLDHDKHLMCGERCP